MDSVGGHQSSSGGVDGAAPFLVKTYEMIDDSSTDDIVSWNPNNKNSFVVWNSLEFARLLLPSHFKHNNFSSFIRQLNIYGFRKIDQKRWEFANEDFIKGQKHLLKNIHRKKPIHNHSQPHGSSLGDIERSAFEEEIEKLTQEKVALRTKLLKFEQEKLEMKLQVEELMNKIHDMEQEQLKMTNFLVKAAENPTFMDHFVKMAGSHFDLSAFHKKRRLLGYDFVQEVADISFVENSSSKLDSGHMFSRDFSNSLRLELSPALSDSNMVSVSSQSSSGDGGSPQNRTSEGDLKDSSTRRECLSSKPEMEEPLGMGISFAVRKDVSVSEPVRVNDFSSIDEGHRLMSCHLNLTLASSSLLQGNIDHCPAKFPGLGQEVISSNELRSSGSDGREAELGVSSTNRKLSDDYPTLSSSQQATEVSNIHGSGAPKGRVNDVFWEQFLTERPGPTDVEKASSSIRANPENEQEERNTEHGNSRRSKQDMEQLTL